MGKKGVYTIKVDFEYRNLGANPNEHYCCC